jgi:hypothetical protein
MLLCPSFTYAQPTSRQILLEKTAVSQLLATPLFNVTVTSLLNCRMLCLAADKCAYITFSQSINTCTLYSKTTACNPTSVNVAGLQVYAFNSKNIAVSMLQTTLRTWNHHFSHITNLNFLLCSIRTRRNTRVPVTHVNIRARVPIYSRPIFSTRALVHHSISETSVKVSVQSHYVFINSHFYGRLVYN